MMTARPRPALVIFDMDDVLCHYDLGRRLRLLASMAGTTARDVRAALWDSGFEDAADAGAYPQAGDYLAAFNERLGHALTVDEWLSARRVSMVPMAETLAMARAVAMQAEVALFTNNGPLVKGHFAELFPEAAAIFKTVHCSYEFGTKKPDPEAYRRLLERLKHRPEEAFFTDDKRSNVQGARLAGLAAHHFRHAGLLAEELAGLGFTL